MFRCRPAVFIRCRPSFLVMAQGRRAGSSTPASSSSSICSIRPQDACRPISGSAHRSYDGQDMTGNLKLSDGMATYRRAETLRETIHHLANQDLDPVSYEVIIIDDGSPDDTRAVVEEAQTRVPFQLTYL